MKILKILEWTQRFLAVGIAIMPLHHRSKAPILSTWREFQTRLPDENDLRQWFPTDWNNYAVICGWQNLVVIDFDSIEFYNVWRLAMSGTQYGLDGLQVRTRKGMHVYLRTEVPCANDKRIAKSGGIDIQAQGKYVVGPGSTHPSGHVYGALGAFDFPIVPSIEAILPLELFPRVRIDDVVFNGAPILFENHTEYQSDPFTMASIDTRDLISKVKASVRIETLFRGQRSSVDGRWFKALCPFHDDRHESFWIDTARQLCGCQVCGMKPMDAINLYSRMHNISERAAVTALAQEVGIWK